MHRRFAPEISGPPEVPVYAAEVPAPGRKFRYITPEVPPFGPVLPALRESEPNGQIFRAPI